MIRSGVGTYAVRRRMLRINVNVRLRVKPTLFHFSLFQGEDNTIFFLTVGNAKSDDFYDPIGFVTTPAPVVHIEWSPAEFVSL